MEASDLTTKWIVKCVCGTYEIIIRSDYEEDLEPKYCPCCGSQAIDADWYLESYKYDYNRTN